jgi:RNA polymerase sigma-70 factor (ECF subfamily)
LSNGDPVLAARIAAERPWLERHALSMIYSRPDADDLVQDCLTTALSNTAGLQHPERLRGWLLSILTNLFRMRFRSQTQRAVVYPIEDFADSLAASVLPEDWSAGQDLVRAMEKLSTEHRRILLLVHVEGQSYHEAADILGVPIGTVMSRLARARHGLRALLLSQNDAASAARNKPSA